MTQLRIYKKILIYEECEFIILFKLLNFLNVYYKSETKIKRKKYPQNKNLLHNNQ